RQCPGAAGLASDHRGRPALAGATPTAADDDYRRRVRPTRRLRLAIVAGGRSSEHEISLASARSVAGALDPERYDIAEVAIGRDGRWAIESPTSSGHVLVSDTETGPAETLPVPAE